MSLYTMVNGLKMLKCYHMCFNAKCIYLVHYKKDMFVGFRIILELFGRSNQTGNAIYVSSYITKRQLFTTHGLPEMILLNDATAYTSSEFQNFTANNIAIEIYSNSENSNAWFADDEISTKKHGQKKACRDYELIIKLLTQHMKPNGATGYSTVEFLMYHRPEG
ncbi:hypothetical protein D917_00987 [Trichinella nativa]|uniref:Integrase catalytic domain-containing protein n=1 Tax=Trichinella nativa TaxID=6335 RepID=A0A1Y3EVW3_9BILA|nr:hypothetical protein D917_00987 [Trichinella nativa]